MIPSVLSTLTWTDLVVAFGAAVLWSVIGRVLKIVWVRLSSSRRVYLHALTSNRRNYSLALAVIIVCGFIIAGITFRNAMSVTGILTLSVISFVSLAYHLIRELNAFWGAGFNYVSSNVPESTYKNALDMTTTSFSMIGTNAYSFCEFKEFEDMVRRVRESSGRVQLLLAHPDSRGLKEAALSRGQSENHYSEQARYALGRIVELKAALGAPIDILLYQADRQDDLPIFRIMFVNDAEAIASIAVYGRPDDGRSLPQLYARRLTSRTNSHRSVYNVLHRYFVSICHTANPMNNAESDACRNVWLSGRQSASLSRH